MKKLIEYFIDKSLLVNLFTVMVSVVGLISIITMQKETFPRVDFDVITIRANYPGAAAEEVEKLVTIAYERQLKGVEGIEDINAMSGEGYSVLVVTVDPEYNKDKVLDDIRNAVDSAKDIPNEVEDPYITSINNQQQAIISVALLGNDEWELREEAKKLRDKLERLSFVANISLGGYRSEILEIQVDPVKLEKNELTLRDISYALKDRNINISAGTAYTDEKEILVRTNTEFHTKEEVEQIIIRSNYSGSSVKIKEIASVNNTLKDTDSTERGNGKKSIFLRVVAKSDADILTSTEIVRNEVDKYFSLYKTDIEYKFFDRMAYRVKRRLSVLTQNGFQGIFLVFLCLVAFMSFRVSVITSLGAPLAFLCSFAIMDFYGMSLNLITMFALILVLGMLVDDSIIVAEYFYQLIEKGMKPKEAARKAALESLAPVTATIITTVVAFGALFFMGGIMGKFLWSVPAVVIICLAASWIECFFILPSHLADFVKVKKDGIEKTKWYQPLLNKYENILKKALNFPKITVTIFIVLFFLSLGIAKTMKFELFSGDDVTQFYVKLKGKVGIPRSETEKEIIKVEQIVMNALKSDELETVRTFIGSQRSPQGSNRVGSHYAQVTADISFPQDRERSSEEIIKVITELVKAAVTDFDVKVEKREGGPPKGEPINIEISGDSLEELKEYALKIRGLLEKIPGVTSTEVDFEDGKAQYILKIDEEKARQLNISNFNTAFEVRRIYEGEIATKIRRSDEDIDVILRMNEDTRKSIKVLNDISVSNNQGDRVKLANFTTTSEEPGAFVIRRLNYKRTISITGQIDKATTTPSVVLELVRPKLDDLIKDSNLTYAFSGENKDTAKSMAGLKKAAMIALFLIFIILVAMFGSLGQPLIIMSAIPLGMIGVIFSFKIMAEPLSFMAMMGVIGLVGVVVNDSIVLVNSININIKNKTADDSIFELIKTSCLSRFRPVILTTFTTVVGLLPIAHATNGDPFLKPMALSFAYGLFFSTALTLLFVPSVYFIYETKIVTWIKSRFSHE